MVLKKKKKKKKPEENAKIIKNNKADTSLFEHYLSLLQQLP